MAKKLDYNYCKASYILEWMGNKWMMATLLQISKMPDGCCRFGDLFRVIPQVSEKMLASTLQQLEYDGLVSRTAYDEQPPRVEYSLTPLGESFLREVSYVMEWGQIHHDEVMRNREKCLEQGEERVK